MIHLKNSLFMTKNTMENLQKIFQLKFFQSSNTAEISPSTTSDYLQISYLLSRYNFQKTFSGLHLDEFTYATVKTLLNRHYLQSNQKYIIKILFIIIVFIWSYHSFNFHLASFSNSILVKAQIWILHSTVFIYLIFLLYLPFSLHNWNCF